MLKIGPQASLPPPPTPTLKLDYFRRFFLACLVEVIWLLPSFSSIFLGFWDKKHQITKCALIDRVLQKNTVQIWFYSMLFKVCVFLTTTKVELFYAFNKK